VFDDMLKKPCPYHKTPVHHTLEQCDMLKKFYGRTAAKEAEAKKDGGDGDAGGFPAVENVFLIFGGPTVDIRDPVTPFSNRSASFTRDEPINSTRSFKPFGGSISPWPSRNPSLNRGKSTFTSARSSKFARDSTSLPSSRSFSFTKNSSDSSPTGGPRNPL
jgi:hypothetical protein